MSMNSIEMVCLVEADACGDWSYCAIAEANLIAALLDIDLAVRLPGHFGKGNSLGAAFYSCRLLPDLMLNEF